MNATKNILILHMICNRIKGSGEFLERFRFDSFSGFYFRSLLIGYMLKSNDNTITLQESHTGTSVPGSGLRFTRRPHSTLP